MAPGTCSQNVGSRRSQRRVHRSYREDSISDDHFSDEESEEYNAGPSRSRQSAVASKATVLSRVAQSKPSATKRKSTYSQLPPSYTRKVSIHEEQNACKISKKRKKVIYPIRRIPPWHALPFHVLVQVFRYASQPVIGENFYPTSSTRWLARTALVCKTFAEPALCVLYYAPPLFPPSRVRGFLSRLQSKTSAFNYQSWVKYVDVEAMGTLYRKDKGHDPIDMGEVIKVVPQLRGIGMHLHRDMPGWHRSSQGLPRGKAVEALQLILDALQQQNITLEEWKWNEATSVCMKESRYSMMEMVHRSHPFQRLSKLSVVALEERDYRDTWDEESTSPAKMLGIAISALSKLRELHLILLPHVNDTLMPLLPRDLELLEIIECSIDSETLASFLSSHGYRLRRLILNHNQSLNLSFLSDLADSCPVLELLTVKLNYYRTIAYSFSNTSPRFASLLQEGEIPSWPASLRQLELLHLRQWDNDTANNFFLSLIKAARHLKELRHLNLKVSLNNSGWRERICFRDKWVARFEKVFLRQSPQPNPHLSSIHAYEAFKAQQAKSDRAGEADSNSRKRLKRVEIPPTKAEEPASAAVNDSSDEPLIRKRRSSRLKQSDDVPHNSSFSHPRPRRRQRRVKISDDDESSEDSALDDEPTLEHRRPEAQSSDDDDELFIQGMCDTVRLCIDNLHPWEDQLNESDFLDDYVSTTDQEWEGA